MRKKLLPKHKHWEIIKEDGVLKVYGNKKCETEIKNSLTLMARNGYLKNVTQIKFYGFENVFDLLFRHLSNEIKDKSFFVISSSSFLTLLLIIDKNESLSEKTG